uniref:Uncharacterized protein n=1 Tax=Helianthus grosseserratus TaxID=73291 RepID=A0A7G8JST5_HELGR|nr:hypothetical protein JAA21_mgp29 [Helianthus grosseserratus]QNJ33633.1 hypothetical protein [Helianthus grosseserratus]
MPRLDKFTYFFRFAILPLFTILLGRFLGPGCPGISTLFTFFFLLVTLILVYRMRVSKRKKSSFLFFVILILIYVLATFSRSFFIFMLAGMPSAFVCKVSSESGDATSLPPLGSSESSESLATFRAEIAGENEAEIFTRIRNLETQDYYNLPPQNNPGEYEVLVREEFEQALDVPHYRTVLDREYFELTVLERKGLLQDRLFHLMLGEQKISRIMELSPYQNIRMEAYNFLEASVEPVSALEHPFQKDLMEGTLNFFIKELTQNGINSEIYKNFYIHFTDELFRVKLGLPLP